MLVRGFFRVAYARPRVVPPPRREPPPAGWLYDATVVALLLVFAVAYFTA